MVNAANWQSEKLVLGRFVTSADVGQFSMGSDLANLPTRILLSPLLVALLPAFSLIRHDPERLKSSYLRVLRSVIFVGIPILVFLCIVASSATTLPLGPKWTQACLGLQVLSLATIPTMYAAMISPLVMALDKAHLFFRRNLYELFVKLPLMAAGAALGGFNGFLFATAASAIVTNLLSMSFVHRILGVTVTAQITAPLRTYVSLMPACGFLILSQNWLSISQAWQLAELAAMLICASALYFVADMALWIFQDVQMDWSRLW
jgi:O-antigen/teichoic acid export membrane protein